MQRWLERYEKPAKADQTPVEMPVQAPETTQEMLGRMIAEHLARQAAAEGFGTWEEEDDFEDEEPDVLDFSAYELEEIQDEADLPDPEEEPPPPAGLSGGDAAEEAGAEAPSTHPPKPDTIKPDIEQ